MEHSAEYIDFQPPNQIIRVIYLMDNIKNNDVELSNVLTVISVYKKDDVMQVDF